MFVIYFIYSIIVAILTLSETLFFLITCFWFLLIPGYKKLKLFTYIVATPWIFFFLKICLFMRLKIIGKNNLDYNRKTLYICNHQSWVDVPIFYGYTKACGVAKKEVKYLPLVGLLIVYSGGAIFFDRKKQSSRMSIVKETIKLFRQNVSMFVFPEGTRSKDGRLLEANKAIIKLCYKLNIPVVPSALEGTRDILPKNRIYLKPFKKVILQFNEAIEPKSYNNEDDFADACWDNVQKTHKNILKEYFPIKYKQIYEI